MARCTASRRATAIICEFESAAGEFDWRFSDIVRRTARSIFPLVDCSSSLMAPTRSLRRCASTTSTFCSRNKWDGILRIKRLVFGSTPTTYSKDLGSVNLTQRGAEGHLHFWRYETVQRSTFSSLKRRRTRHQKGEPRYFRNMLRKKKKAMNLTRRIISGALLRKSSDFLYSFNCLLRRLLRAWAFDSGKLELAMQPRDDLHIVRLILWREDTVPDEEIQHDQPAVWLELAPPQRDLDFLCR